MEIIKQSHEILHYDNLDRIERAGRTCYKSEDKITEESAPKFIKMLIKRGHEAMLEHGGATVKFTTDRGVTHELVRHRLCSFGQESTRYVNYSGSDIKFILPVWCTKVGLGIQDAGSVGKLLDKELEDPERVWQYTMLLSEDVYNDLIKLGWPPEKARSVLPNSLKTEIVVTANYREWRHIMKLRAIGTTGKPHPQMQALMIPLLKEFKEKVPAIFDDLEIPNAISN